MVTPAKKPTAKKPTAKQLSARIQKDSAALNKLSTADKPKKPAVKPASKPTTKSKK